MESLFQSIPYSPAMGDNTPKPSIVCCPLCGASLPRAIPDNVHNCPTCGFDLLLVQASKEPTIRLTVPAYIPRFSFWLIFFQMGLAVFFGVLFAFFASSVYSLFSLVFAGIHLVSIGALPAFAWALRREIAISEIRIALLVLGCFTLPLGALAIAAAIAIAPLRRWCCACGKSLRWSAYIECPHCHASMHSTGRCRQNQFHQIAGVLDHAPSQSEINQICANCLKVMEESAPRRDKNE